MKKSDPIQDHKNQGIKLDIDNLINKLHTKA